MEVTKLHPVVQELIGMVKDNEGWQGMFEAALKKCHDDDVADFDDIKTLDDFYKWIDDQLNWIPVEDNYGTVVYNHLAKFYFLFDQEPVRSLQNLNVPENTQPQLTPLSKWIQKFCIALGEWMDDPKSINNESLATFNASPRYNMGEYIQPRGGWKTFNQMFARNTKPGYRPIAGMNDDSVIVSPADSTNAGQWEVRADSHVTIKGLHWKISELLSGSPYADRFKGGIWIHQFLNTTDYHRQHAPVAGKVLESRMIQGACYLEVKAEPVESDPSGRKHVVMKREWDLPDSPGYQFQQARGLVVIDSPIGLVAVLPMGMASVSSIIMTAEEGRTLQKGEEISYFQFGGSDIVVVFEQASNVCITAQPGVHYKVGTAIAKAYPVITR